MPNQNNEQGNQNTLPVSQEQMDALKNQAEQKIDATIDQFAQKIPGGQQYSQQAKDAAAGGLDNLEKQAEEKFGNPGGMFGGNQ